MGIFLPFALLPAQAQSYESELNLGVAAYKVSHYEEALQHFRKATELDPSKPAAHLYLATTYVGRYIPGVESPDNVGLAEQALEQYERVLDSDPALQPRISSTKGIAYLYLNMKKWDEAKTYYQKASGLDRDDPEPYYSIGVIDWTRCYQPRMEARAQLDMRPGDQLSAKNPGQKQLCDDLRARNMPMVEEGIDSLNKAIRRRPDYDDAMAYLNLMYREKADLECENPIARAKDLRTAEHWVDLALRAKEQKAEKSKALEELRAPNPQ